MDAAHLLADLDPEQRRAVTTTTQPLCILAGAGSGKTRVLTRRIAYRTLLPPDEGGADPRHVLALTFTRKAAAELKERLRRFGLRDRPQAGTFHSLAWAQLRIWYRDEAHRSMPSLLSSKGRLLADLPSRGGFPTFELATEIEWANARDIRPDDYALAARQHDRRPATSFDHIAALMGEYERAKHSAGVLDFDDMLLKCANVFEDDPRFAEAQRWRFRHLFVDEFQDVNPLQYRMLRAWLGDRNRDLCVVGDPNQAIYRWNGADASYLRLFKQHFPGSETVDLRRNYRSTPQILHVATSVLGVGDRIGFTAHRSSGDVPTFRRLGSAEEEARTIAREAQLLHAPGARWDDQAVLVRTNGQMAALEQAFAKHRVPFRSRSGEPLTANPHIKAAMRHVVPSSPQPFQVIVDDLALLAIEARADDEPSRGYALDTLVRLAQELADSDPGAGINELWGYLKTSGGELGPGPEGDAVDLLTFHSAKGLEWRVVHLAGLEDGFVPIARGKSAEVEAEERRLFHVAMTRATQHLRMYMAYSRDLRGTPVTRHPTPYADRVTQAIDELRRAELQDPAAGLASAREALVASTPLTVDRDLLGDLQAWRAAVARRAGTAPAVVASDRVLSDVARLRPLDLGALGQVRGVGPSALAEHGEAIVAIVARHAAPASTP